MHLDGVSGDPALLLSVASRVSRFGQAPGSAGGAGPRAAGRPGRRLCKRDEGRSERSFPTGAGHSACFISSGSANWSPKPIPEFPSKSPVQEWVGGVACAFCLKQTCLPRGQGERRPGRPVHAASAVGQAGAASDPGPLAGPQLLQPPSALPLWEAFASKAYDF